MQRRDRRDAAQENGGSLQGLELTLVPTVGFANLPDSPAKFYRVTEILKTFALMVREEAVDDEGLAFLGGIYGPHPSVAAQALTARFKHYLDVRKSGGDEAARAASRQVVLEAVEAEIAWFEGWAAVDRQARAELAAPYVEAEMLAKPDRLERAMLYQERLERRFDKKWKLLTRYRRMREAERLEANLFGDDAPAVETVPVRQDDEFQASEKTDARNAKMNERSRQPIENTGEASSDGDESRQPVENGAVSKRGRQLIDSSRDSSRNLELREGQEGQGKVQVTGPGDKKGGSI